MKIPVRKTAQGTEYWDNLEKRTVFIPTGVKPDFEVTENPKSLIGDPEDNKQENKVKELQDMTIPELKDYAKEKEMEIPSDTKKKEDIIKLIQDNWNPDEK